MEYSSAVASLLTEQQSAPSAVHAFLASRATAEKLGASLDRSEREVDAALTQSSALAAAGVERLREELLVLRQAVAAKDRALAASRDTLRTVRATLQQALDAAGAESAALAESLAASEAQVTRLSAAESEARVEASLLRAEREVARGEANTAREEAQELRRQLEALQVRRAESPLAQQLQDSPPLYRLLIAAETEAALARQAVKQKAAECTALRSATRAAPPPSHLTPLSQTRNGVSFMVHNS